VAPVAEPGKGGEGLAQGRLVREEQADCAHVGEAAPFGHAQPEGGRAGALGRKR